MLPPAAYITIYFTILFELLKEPVVRYSEQTDLYCLHPNVIWVVKGVTYLIALKLTDIKTFMNQLLCSEIFDHFLLSEATIAKDATFTIDGHINSDFYSKEDLEEEGLSNLSILPYAKLRPACYQLIRGKHTPVYFKFILMLSPENLANTLAHSDSGLSSHDVNGILLNLTFQNGQLTLTTGISYSNFTMNHTLDHEWDAMIQKFLNKHSISFEEL